MMKQEEQLQLECRLHSLLCGQLEPGGREELLARIARDDAVRDVLGEMVSFQQACRRAAGLEQAPERARESLAALRERLASPGAMPGSPSAMDRGGGAQAGHRADVRRKPRRWRRWFSPSWWVRIAAVVVVAASAYVAWMTHRGGQAVDQRLVAHDPVVVSPSGEELARYRMIWNQVTDRGNTWVLLKEGSGQFGSLSPASAPAPDGKVLLVQCRVVNDQGTVVYSADLLLPDQPSLRVRLPEAGPMAGQRTALAVTAADDRTTVGLSVHDSSAATVGVTGQALIGKAREIGSFRLQEQDLRLFVRAERLSGFQS